MQFLARSVFAALSLLLLTAPAHSQQLLNVTPGAFFKHPAVQRELNLSPDQVGRAENLAKLMWERVSQASQELQRAGGTPEAKKALKEKYGEIEQAYAKDLADVLKPVQMKRLQEINLQRRGIYAFTDSELEVELKLTAKQKTKIETLCRVRTERARAQSKLRKDRSDEARAKFKELTDLNANDIEFVTTLLDERQKKIWVNLIGAPFKDE